MGNPATPVLLALLPFTLLLLCLLAYRFRKVPCPPTCRRCNYDVSHRPEGATLCSECGADLTQRRAILTRRRARLSPRARTLAVFLLLLSAAWPAYRARRVDWRSWYLNTAPDRLIAFHAERSTGPLATDALAEWLRRYRNKQLTPAARDRLFDYLLAWQADTSRTWDLTMGDLLLQALLAHVLSDDRADRFTNNTFIITTLQIRTSIHAGDPVALEYAGVERGYTDPDFSSSFSINGSFRQPSKPNTDQEAFTASAGLVRRGEISAHDAATSGLSPGPARLHFLFVRRIYNYRAGFIARTAFTRQAFYVAVLPPATPLATPLPNPAVADAVAQSARFFVYRAKSGQLFAQVRLAPAPVDRAFNVLVNPEHPLLVTQRFAPANQSDVPLDATYEELLPIEVPRDQASIQIQLVGSDAPLRHSVHQENFWPGTITYTVPIRNDDSSGYNLSLSPYVITRRH